MSVRRVIKVGGSWLRHPGVRERIAAWRSRQTRAAEVWLAGGGELADVIRQWQPRLGLSDETSHWLAVGTLSVTASLLSELLALPRCLSLSEVAECLEDGASCVLDVAGPLRAESNPLPRTWDVTSDSLAAWVATRLPAEELVLLKSTGPCLRLPADPSRLETLRQLAEQALVDAHFAVSSHEVPMVRVECG